MTDPSPLDPVDPGVAHGRYANYFNVGFNAHELVMDFGQFYPAESPPAIHTRIITTPAYARALTEMLVDALRRYDETYGQADLAAHDPEE